jgi:hypothetical protein
VLKHVKRDCVLAAVADNQRHNKRAEYFFSDRPEVGRLMRHIAWLSDEFAARSESDGDRVSQPSVAVESIDSSRSNVC